MKKLELTQEEVYFLTSLLTDKYSDELLESIKAKSSSLYESMLHYNKAEKAMGIITKLMAVDPSEMYETDYAYEEE